LWGPNSYNTGAGLYRISRFAAFVKYNMPFTPVHVEPQLTDEQAWDVAAYVNSQPRDTFHAPEDWPDISSKPPDHPFGPFADGFSEHQHKYGPFQPIVNAKEKQKGNK
jgi:thiosulfate dehydrogenase